MKRTTLRFGVDLGGTKTEGVILDGERREVWRERTPTDASSYDAVLSGVERLYRRMRGTVHDAPHTLGIGTPGAVSRRTGLLKNSNTTCLNGMPVARDLRARLGRELAIENDANCFALAEALAGAGRGNRVVFGAILGTGCGGGIVLDGKVHGGLQSIAGEWGHTVIDPAGPPCYCGARGCVETFISGSGLEKRHAERSGARLPVDRIVAAWRAGDLTAMAAMDDFFARFGQALANLIAVLDPDVVVLGGGLSNVDELYVRGVDEVRARVFSDSLDTPIVKHRLGDSAGVIGAALVGA
ncbi:MAG TPA: ROK family protein [Burkholderiales bacterium]|nr:ROK family protein [Burkholderiales bacterium]